MPHEEFKGFDDWIEIFRAGSQTDSSGKTIKFSHDDLDSIIESHEPAPIVVGHPKDNAPAYGWSKELKRKGDILLGKFSDINPDFAQAVKNKTYPNRSISLVPINNGYKLRHTGWLGAAAPAIKGLKQVEFSADENALEFSNWQTGYGLGLAARILRKLREWLIDEHGKDAADQILPNHEIDELKETSDAICKKPNQETNFSQGETTMSKKEYSETEIQKIKDDAREAAELEFKQKMNDLNAENKNLKDQAASTKVDDAIAEFKAKGIMTPAMEPGIKDFMLSLEPELTFEFSEGDKTTKTVALDWFIDFMGKAKPTVDVNQPKVDEDMGGGSSDVQNAARNYMEKNPGMSYAEAVSAVSDKQGE